MTEKKIKITISPIGNPTIEAEGFYGQGCAEATKNLEQVFSGGGETVREYKPEWNSYAEEAEHVKQSW